jgi:hypothetical protein
VSCRLLPVENFSVGVRWRLVYVWTFERLMGVMPTGETDDISTCAIRKKTHVCRASTWRAPPRSK